MVEYMKLVCQNAPRDLSLEERNLLSVAYKNVVGARRASLRIIGSIENKEQSKDGGHLSLVKSYKSKVEEELNNICNDILDLLSKTLIKDSLSAEPKVFYQKMKADYYRYLAEFAVNEQKSMHSKEAEAAYTEATNAAGFRRGMFANDGVEKEVEPPFVRRGAALFLHR